MSRKYLFVLFWAFALPLALAVQIFLFKTGSPLSIPIYELTLISGVITGIYFGVNVVTKTVLPVTNFIPEKDIEKMISDVQKSENISSSRYSSRKFFLTAFWCIYMVVLMLVQLIISELKLPVMESVTIAAILTGAYFGTNILDKIVVPRAKTPSNNEIPIDPIQPEQPEQPK